MTRTTRIRVTNRATRSDGNGEHAAATRYDNDGDREYQTVTMKMKAARKTKRRHGEDDGDRKDEEDEDETTKAKTKLESRTGRRGPTAMVSMRQQRDMITTATAKTRQ